VAQMIPAMPAEGTQSQAEWELFPILHDGLDGNLTIFHSVGTEQALSTQRAHQSHIIDKPLRNNYMLTTKRGGVRRLG